MAARECTPVAASRRARQRRGTVLSLALAAAGAVGITSRGLGSQAQVQLEVGDGESHTLVLLRHGESQWNHEKRFTGWVDVDLTENGIEEAIEAGRLMKEAGITFNMAFTSLQKRAIKSLTCALEQLDLLWIPVTKSWRLNERMYGDLQGMTRAEAREKFGHDRVAEWRRSFAMSPPPISDDNPFHPKFEEKYKAVPQDQLPMAESLELTIKRMLPLWNSSIAPALKKGNKVVIVSHCNSIRALVMYLDSLPDDEITKLKIPTGVPLVYKLDKSLKPVKVEGAAPGLSGRYLGDHSWLAARMSRAAN